MDISKRARWDCNLIWNIEGEHKLELPDWCWTKVTERIAILLAEKSIEEGEAKGWILLSAILAGPTIHCLRRSGKDDWR